MKTYGFPPILKSLRLLSDFFERKEDDCYLPPEERTPDVQYRTILKNILETGRKVYPVHDGYALMLAGQQMRFLMKNGFPLITEKDQSGSFKGALGELIAFMNGARTLEDLRKYGCPDVYWARWVTKEKCDKWQLPPEHLGYASYGPVWTEYPTRDGGKFNQIANMVEQIKKKPNLRTHRLSNYYPPECTASEETRRVVVVPCHGDLQILVFPKERELIVHHTQRSGDMPSGVPNNMVHYAAFGMMLAQATGYAFTELVHYIVDAHIYDIQIPYVEELLCREPRAFPTVALDKNSADIFQFRREHFHLTDYHPHPKMLIPTRV
jgi:thymidylate synthase